MVQTKIAWGDGSSDMITVSYSGAVGSSSMQVESDPNSSVLDRTKTINLKDEKNTPLATLTISQKARKREYSSDYDYSYQ